MLATLFSITLGVKPNVFASEPVDQVKELKIEDAILKAQQRNKRLRMQQSNIAYAEVDSEDAYYNYQNSWDIGFENASAGYSQARINQDYEIKYEETIKEQIAYDIEGQFDNLLELEEKYELAQKGLNIQQQKVNHAVKKEQLGLGSKHDVETVKALLATQKKEIDSLLQSIDAGYRKLNDAIGGKDERYDLIKENIYEPLDMKRSLQGQVSYAIDSDLGIWKQEESAKNQKITLTAPVFDAFGSRAPTYAEYQKRKIGYEQGLSNVSLSKEGKEKQVKEIYENILALEIQYDRMLIEKEEMQRKYNIVAKQFELGMVTGLVLEETEQGISQIDTQINTIVRQHNQLKILFDKSYLAAGQ